MGVMEYNEDTDIEESIEYNENEIINKLNAIQTQLGEFCILLKDLKKDFEEFKLEKSIK